MGSYSTNELRNGMKVMMDGDPCSVLENEYVKPGKGQAFNRMKLRNLKTGRVLERTLKSGDVLESADVVDMEMQYLYSDGQFWHFMSQETFEQHTANQTALGDAKDWLKEQEIYVVTLYNGQPLSIAAPNTLILKVTETEPGVRGDTVTGGSKPAKLETGVTVRVPLFINEGDLIKVDTRSAEYLSRAKE